MTGPSPALPILTFHALDDLASVISFSPRVFQEGIAMLRARGYHALTLQGAVALLRAGRPFPARAFVLTFDDGFESMYTEAFPVLQRHGMTATVFLTVDAGGHSGPDARLPSFEGRRRLSWSEIRTMHAAGIEFGAHTLTHPDLTRLPEEQIAVEMSSSQDRIEQALATPVRTFAYPFGRFDATSQRIARRYFDCACADTLGFLSPRSDPYALERVDAYYLRTRRLFALTVTGLFRPYVTARNLPRRLRRAIRDRRLSP
jgi:peptidoglycan/xylan/chitin deacetylase (PgdA/CDA1 family)